MSEKEITNAKTEGKITPQSCGEKITHRDWGILHAGGSM